jgi:hypothetical protein
MHHAINGNVLHSGPAWQLGCAGELVQPSDGFHLSFLAAQGADVLEMYVKQTVFNARMEVRTV